MLANCIQDAFVWRANGLLLLLVSTAMGCGTTKSRLATEQLLVSDAVDHAVSHIDFRPLAGRKVYFDTQYIKNIKGVGFVNSDYIISALRQQMLAADCRLQDNQDTAEYIVEARVGTVGTNDHEIVFGVPASNILSTAASLMPNAPAIPTIPEISFARKDGQVGAAKIAVFAYDGQTRRPVWQSGISRAKSSAQDFWFLGAGPFQRGSIYEGTQFAGSKLRLPHPTSDDEDLEGPPVAYDEEFLFRRRDKRSQSGPVRVADFQDEIWPVEEQMPTEEQSPPEEQSTAGEKPSAEAKPSAEQEKEPPAPSEDP